MTQKLAIVATHPIQYHSPWYCYLAGRTDLSARVFYLWDPNVDGYIDPGFKRQITWDIQLLSGYAYTFVPNRSKAPGTHRFWGLWNPSIIAELRAYEPDAVLLHGYNFATFIYLILRLRHIPLVFRGDSHRIVRRKGPKEWLRRLLITHIFRRCVAFLYVGSANYEYFRYHGVPAAKLFRAPHAVDNERFLTAVKAETDAKQWKEQLGIPSTDLIILFAGKLEPKKRPFDLLEAYLSAGLSGVSLVFVGSGVLEARLMAAAGAHPKIYFAPFQNQTLMPRTYCAADIFVLPSRSESETWGLAINEAMCMGRAVIVSDHVGCARDLVMPYRNGLIFPAGDVAALASCLREALSDHVRLRRWGEHSRQIIKTYSYRELTEGLMNAMRTLGLHTQANR